MTETKHERACQILAEIKGIKTELASWEYATTDNIRSPLTFRMSGTLNHTPPQAFSDFKLACITGLTKKIEELRMEFESL